MFWYRYRSKSAAENFIIEVENGIKAICRDPFLFKKTDQEYRELVLHKYPFNVVYSINEAKLLITIVAIYHQSRTPQAKYRKP